jgi:hypothetical protein
MKFGFELELFCHDLKDKPEGVPCLVPLGLPYDECGWLVEVRSEPHTDIRKAIALLLAECDAVTEKADKAGIALIKQPTMDIPRDLKVKAARAHGKGILRYRNIYGHENHRTRLATASLHISFTSQQDFGYWEANKDGKTYRTF